MALERWEWDSLSPKEQAFFTALINQLAIEPDGVGEYLVYLRQPERIPGEILRYCHALKPFEVTRNQQRYERVKDKWEHLFYLIDEQEEVLRDKQIALLLHGSLLYGDPRHCDLDLTAVTDNYSGLVQWFVSSWGLDLDRPWQAISGRGGTDFFYLNMAELGGYCLAFAGEEYRQLSEGDIFHIKDAWSKASTLLNGCPVYQPPGVPLAEWRDEVFRLCKTLPLMGSTVCLTLKECLDNRTTRLGTISKVWRRIF